MPLQTRALSVTELDPGFHGKLDDEFGPEQAQVIDRAVAILMEGHKPNDEDWLEWAKLYSKRIGEVWFSAARVDYLVEHAKLEGGSIACDQMVNQL